MFSYRQKEVRMNWEYLTDTERRRWTGKDWYYECAETIWMPDDFANKKEKEDKENEKANSSSNGVFTVVQ
jgi:hypothetical protein